MTKFLLALLILGCLVYFAYKWLPATKNTPSHKKQKTELNSSFQLFANQPLVLAALVSLAVYDRSSSKDIFGSITKSILVPLSSQKDAMEAMIVARSFYSSINDPIEIIDNASKYMLPSLKKKDVQSFLSLLQDEITKLGGKNSPFYLNRFKLSLQHND